MIEVRKGSLLDVTKGLIVHGCNARGVMGSGVAKQIKETYPDAYSEYLEGHELGTVSFSQGAPGLYIANAVTQEFYGRDGRRYTSYDAVTHCFQHINYSANRLDIKDIHFPLIGAGLGGGNWTIIATIIEETLDPHFNKILWKL